MCSRLDKKKMPSRRGNQLIDAHGVGPGGKRDPEGKFSQNLLMKTQQTL